MSTVIERLQQLREKNAHVNLGGGKERIEAQHKASKMTAHERLHLLYDNGFYDELFRFIEHHSTSFGMAGCDLPSDGVVTGLGAIRGRLVYASSQDFTVMGGSVGLMHAMGPNVAGVIGTAIAAGVLLAIVG